MHSLRGSLVNTCPRETRFAYRCAYIYIYTNSFPVLRLWGSCFVNPFRRNRRLDCGRPSREREGSRGPEEKRREERSRSGFGGRRPLGKSTVQVALRGRLQTCSTCYVLDLGLYEYRSIVWPVMPMIIVFGALFFKECLSASRAGPAVF